MSERSERIVVTGVGLLSALGDSASALDDALAAGASGLRPVTVVSTEGLGECVAGEIADFDAARYLGEGNLRPLDRTSRLATAAASLALRDAGLADILRADDAADGTLGDRAGLVLGTMFGSVRTIAEFDRRALTAGPNYVSPLDFANSVINAAAGHAAIWLGLRGTNATLAGGASAGAQAIGYAADQLRDGRADVLLAGGAEELSFEALLGMARLRKLAIAPRPFAADRAGAALGEGAALLVLEPIARAEARGARVHGEVLGHGVAYGVAGGGELGLATALANALRAALEQAGLAPEAIDAVAVGASGDPLLDGAEARALEKVFGDRAVPLLVTKAALGETLGAGGALQAAALLAAMARGRLAGSASAGDGCPPGLASAARSLSIRYGAVTTVDADGQAAALVFGAGAADATP
jgi:3-oxoacyl-[acyl-carrier-protein] synthase II